MISDYDEDQTKIRLQLLHQLVQPIFETQRAVCRAVFKDHKRETFFQAGRKSGKSHTAAYISVRTGLIKKDYPCYYVAPFKDQAYEIIWAGQRLQAICPYRLVKKIYNHDRRIVFDNGSFIKLDGADNHERLRGYTMGLVVNDEIKDFHPDYWSSVVPNLNVTRGTMCSFGTAPNNDVTPQDKFFHSLAARNRAKGTFYQCSSYENPLVDQEELEREKELYISRGEYDRFEIEYLGLYRKGGSSSIFPGFESVPGRHVKPLSDLLRYLYPRRFNLEYWCVADPGTNHPFAVSFWALDPDEQKMYLLWELKVKDQSQNSYGMMYEAIQKTIVYSDLCPDPSHWNYRYDEAALAWFAFINNERENYGWQPTNKQLYPRQQGEIKAYLTTCKDLVLNNNLIVADSCTEFIEEISSYSKDRKGNIPKINDDLLDTFRYLVAESNFIVSPAKKPLPETPRVLSYSHSDKPVDIGTEKTVNNWHPEDTDESISWEPDFGLGGAEWF